MLNIHSSKVVFSYKTFGRIKNAFSSLLDDLRVSKKFSDLHSSMNTVSKLSKYSYWKQRYALKHQNKIPFDWFVDANNIREQLTTELMNLKDKSQSHINVLDIGCGTSSLPSYVYRETQAPISLTCADFISDALRIQKNWLSDTSPGHSNSVVSFVTCNACRIPFLNSMFQIVIDKGMMDSLLKDRISGDSKATAMLKEVYRILIFGGKYLQITDEDPDVRLELLETLSKELPHEISWSFVIIDSDSCKEYFMFQFTKLL